MTNTAPKAVSTLRLQFIKQLTTDDFKADNHTTLSMQKIDCFLIETLNRISIFVQILIILWVREVSWHNIGFNNGLFSCNYRLTAKQIVMNINKLLLDRFASYKSYVAMGFLMAYADIQPDHAAYNLYYRLYDKLCYSTWSEGTPCNTSETSSVLIRHVMRCYLVEEFNYVHDIGGGNLREKLNK